MKKDSLTLSKINLLSFFRTEGRYIVSCRGIVQLGGLVPSYPWDVPVRLRLVSLVYWLISLISDVPVSGIPWIQMVIVIISLFQNWSWVNYNPDFQVSVK